MSVVSIPSNLVTQTAPPQDESSSPFTESQHGLGSVQSSIKVASPPILTSLANINEPSLAASFFQDFRIRRDNLQRLAGTLRAHIEAHKKYTLISSKEEAEEAQEKALSKKIGEGFSVLEEQIQAFISHIDTFVKANPISTDFLLWAEATKNEMEEFDKPLRSEFYRNKTLAKSDLDSDSQSITYDEDKPVPVVWQIRIHDFTLRCSDVIESGQLAENQAVLTQMLLGFESALQAVSSHDREKNKALYPFLEKHLKQMQERFRALPQEVKKRQEINRICKIFTSFENELEVMAEMAQKKLAAPTIQDLSSLSSTLKVKVKDTKEKVRKALNGSSFVKEELVRKALSSLKEKSINLETLKKEIESKILELRMASKRKGASDDAASAKKAKTDMTSPFKEIRFQT